APVPAEGEASGAVVQLREAMGSVRGDELNRLLKLPVAQTDRQAVAELILKKLDEKRFEGLRGADGTSCRAAAVEAVLSLGFPWALHVDPDDLAHLRAEQPGKASFLPGGPMTWGLLGTLVLVILSLLTYALTHHPP